MSEKTYPNDVNMESSDISIGAVEIKDKQGAYRVSVDVDGNMYVIEKNSNDINTNLQAIEADSSSIDSKITACNTGNVTINSLPEVQIKPNDCTMQLVSGEKSVTTAGVAEAIKPSLTKAWRIDIEAKQTNSSKVFVGDSNVDKTNMPVASLNPGDSYTIACPAGSEIDLAEVYLDAEQGSDGVFFNYFTVS